MQGAIVIGGSAGALDALFAILKPLPDAIAAPIVVVIHVLPNQPSLIPALLQKACPHRIVREPEDKEPLIARTIYVAPPNYHLLIERENTFALSVDAPVNFSRPSIDVLFESAADAFGPRLVGILLSGSNADGAAGLARIAQAGGTTVVQADAPYPTMPDAARHLTPTAQALRSDEIARFVARYAGVLPDRELEP